MSSNRRVRRVTKSEFLTKNFIVKSKYGENPKLWPRTTISLCKIIYDGNTAVKKFHKRDSLHAEERLIEDLQNDTNVIAAKKIVIQVYQNYSPCSRCADTIVGYMTGMRLLKKNIKMNITFANFYKTHPYTGNSLRNVERNKEGLRWLVNSGVKLQVFGEHEECQKWKSFLEMNEFFNLSTTEKEKCLKRANSRARKLREETDQSFLKEIYKEDSQLEKLLKDLALKNNNDVE